MWEKNGAIFKRENGKTVCEEASQNVLKSCLFFGGTFGGSYEE